MSSHLKKCGICGKLKPSLKRNFWGDTYCKVHESEYEKCSSCYRLMSISLSTRCHPLKDGRKVCQICYDEAIHHVVVQRSILPSLINFYETKEIFIPRQIEVKLVDRNYIKARTGESLHEPIGIIVKKYRGDVRIVDEIMILYNLPEGYTTMILAHELGHAFLFMNNFFELPDIIEEGLAELFAYSWLKEQTTLDSLFRLKLMELNPNPIYGCGFRAAKKFLETRTFKELLMYVKYNQQFPQI